MTSDDPAVRALRSAMTDGTPALLGWRRIPTTLASVLLFVARGTSPGTWTQAVLRAQPGSPPWRLVTIGECRVQIVPPDGISLAELWLDANRLPQPADRTIRVLVIEMACASGQSAAGRIRAPQLAYRTDSVIALVTVTRQPGGQDCQGNPPAPFDLTLAEPLGSRVLRNGAFLPPPEVRP